MVVEYKTLKPVLFIGGNNMNMFKKAVEQKESTDLAAMLSLMLVSSFNMVFFLDILIGDSFFKDLIKEYHPKHYLLMGFVYSLVGMLAIIIIASLIATIVEAIFKSAKAAVDKVLKVLFITLFGFRFAVSCELVLEIVNASFYDNLLKNGMPEETLLNYIRIATVILTLVGIFIVDPVLEYFKLSQEERIILSSDADYMRNHEKYEKERAKAIMNLKIDNNMKQQLLEENKEGFKKNLEYVKKKYE